MVLQCISELYCVVWFYLGCTSRPQWCPVFPCRLQACVVQRWGESGRAEGGQVRSGGGWERCPRERKSLFRHRKKKEASSARGERQDGIIGDLGSPAMNIHTYMHGSSCTALFYLNIDVDPGCRALEIPLIILISIINNDKVACVHRGVPR